MCKMVKIDSDVYVIPDDLLKWISIYLQPCVNNRFKERRLNIIIKSKNTKDCYIFFKRLLDIYDSPDYVYNGLDSIHKSFIALINTDLLSNNFFHLFLYIHLLHYFLHI